MRQLLTQIASSTQPRARAQIRGAGLAARGTGLAAHGTGLAACGARRPPRTFNGAVLPICGVEVLIVVVRPWVLADICEANLFVVAFYERFRRTIVLMAQRSDGAPRFYGPTEIVRVLQALPLEMIPWRRLLFRTIKPASWQLPIPQRRSGASGTKSVDTDDVIDVTSANLRTTVR